jgi:hypothetical protein
MASTKLKTIQYTNHDSLNRPARTLKMVRPVCAICSVERGHELWWKNCPHQPYFSILEDVRVEFVTETNEDGEEILVQTEGKPIRKMRPNYSQVPYEDKIYSGRGPAWSIEHGFKDPQELGYAPLCEYYNCWTPFPKYKTGWGAYCTADQARIMNLRLEGFPIHTDPKVRRRQLDSVSLGDASGKLDGRNAHGH